ncbi:DUF5707 domain-containing protein [Streptomyces sp. NBC_00490]|uniref:DUF5707 domain-containing protein n=1 Tax=Streptomyces sp. NBC_00490 TaxID=2903657 RepID=UPI002E198845
MSRRVALLVSAGVVALGGAGAFAFAYAGEQPPALEKSTARYTAPKGKGDGSLTFSTDVTANSGVKSVKVLAWPQDSSLGKKGLTAKDMADAESATCTPAEDDKVHCTYKVAVTSFEAEASPHGAWHVAVLATAKNGTTTLDTTAADFTLR